MVVCRSEAKMFGKMVRMIAMSDYRAVMLTFCQKSTVEPQQFLISLEQSTIAIFTARFYLWGTFFK